MKMSDVFELPVVADDYTDDAGFVYDCLRDNRGHRLYDEEDMKAIAHAINMHDDLVEALDCVLTCWLEDCDPSELEIVVSKSLSILTRAKGGFDA